jgi:hypothetical protein
MGIPRNMTLARMIRLNKLASSPHLANSGLREMEEADVPEVAELYTKYMKRFDMSTLMTLDDIRHHLLSGKGIGEKADPFVGRRNEQVTWTYVVEVRDDCFDRLWKWMLISLNRIPRHIRSPTSFRSISSLPLSSTIQNTTCWK